MTEESRPVACVLDVSAEGAATLHHASRLAKQLEAPLVGLYAAPRLPILIPRAKKPWKIGTESVPEVEGDLRAFVHAHLGESPGFTMLPMLGACPAQVADWARSLAARVLVVPATGSAGVGGVWWRGLAEHLVSLAPCPLVIVPRDRMEGKLPKPGIAAREDGFREGGGRCSPERRGAVRDPVCGMLIDPHEAGDYATFAGHLYLFCTAGCRERFERQPRHFTAPNARRRSQLESGISS